MSNIIKHIHIEKLFGTTNIDWELNPSVNVLVGKNGSGKSTILQLIKSIIHQNQDSSELDLCDKAEVVFADNQTLKFNVSYSKSSIELYYKALQHTAKTIEDENFKKLLLESLNNSDIPSNINRLCYFTSPSDLKVKTEFISTINMSANSINNLTTSSGEHTNLLDIEINNEVLRLLAFDNKEILKENLLSALNALFTETNKIIEFEKNKLIVKLTDGTKIDFSQLSSGERQVIFIFLKVVIASVDGALILMDEPEISLHLSWQEKLLNEIRKINNTSQIIIVTHSPAMLMNGWIDSFVDIENIMTEVSTSEEDEEKET